MTEIRSFIIWFSLTYNFTVVNSGKTIIITLLASFSIVWINKFLENWTIINTRSTITWYIFVVLLALGSSETTQLFINNFISSTWSVAFRIIWWSLEVRENTRGDTILSISRNELRLSTRSNTCFVIHIE